MARTAKTSRKPRRKVAVVTGGGSGLGRDCANRLARDGFSVAVIGRRAKRLAPRRGETLHPYVCDVADASETGQTVRAILRDLGRIDALINSAGVIRLEPVDAITQENLRYTLDINLLGTINSCLACLPALKKTKGAIVNLSSNVADRPFPGSAAYAASKGGVDSFSKALALELAPLGVRVNVISPALVRSEIYTSAGMDEQAYGELLLSEGQSFPLGRAGEPRDVSELVAYLVSERASWMTGEVILLDGGKGIA